MGILDTAKKMLGKKNIKKEKYKEAEEDYQIHKMLEERQKSNNRRELERYYKEDEEARIKVALEKIRHKKQSDLWGGKDSVMNQKTIFKEENPILKQKNIFKKSKSNSIPFLSGGGFLK